MNGRIYDPLLGRFLSADILVENAANLQAYNRYSYVRNNPLTLVDPSGWSSLFPVLPLFITSDNVKDSAEGAANFTVGVAAGAIEGNFPVTIDTTGNQAATAGKVVGNALAAAQGIVEVGGGGTMAGGGGLVTVTGVGAPIGVPATAVGTAVAVHGAAVTVNSMNRLKENVQNLKQTVAESRLEKTKVQAKDGDTVNPNPKKDEKGVVYEVDGKDTKSGKDYIGRTSNPEGPPGRGNADGRDRTKAKVVDTYDTTREGKVKEQTKIYEKGLGNLDNKRNEIAPKKRKDYGLDEK